MWAAFSVVNKPPLYCNVLMMLACWHHDLCGKARTPSSIRFVVDLLYNKLYNKSTTNPLQICRLQQKINLGWTYKKLKITLIRKRLMLFALTGTLAILGRWRHLTPSKLLLITNQTKLTLTIARTLTDGNIFTRILLIPIKRLYCYNKRNFCGGSWVGPFFLFSHFLPVCWQEFDSKLILYRWKEGFCGDI